LPPARFSACSIWLSILSRILIRSKTVHMFWKVVR
jgi:hypothetical protein